MKMLRWMCDMARTDRIRNELIKGSLDVLNITRKMKKNYLNMLKKEIMKIQLKRQVK